MGVILRWRRMSRVALSAIGPNTAAAHPASRQRHDKSRNHGHLLFRISSGYCIPFFPPMTHRYAEMPAIRAGDDRYGGGRTCHLHVIERSTTSNGTSYQCQLSQRNQASDLKEEKVMRLYENDICLRWVKSKYKLLFAVNTSSISDLSQLSC